MDKSINNYATLHDWHQRKWLMVICLSFVIYHLSFSAALAQIGTWKAYVSYYEPQQIVKAGTNNLFVRASNGLYNYNLTDQSITTYDKVQQLNDTYITHIAWNQQVQRLIIVYQNSNIDLLDLKGNVTNINALYAKSMTQDKTVNSVYVNGKYAYLATGFGAVKLNMERAEISESYILDLKVKAIAISGNSLLLNTSSGVFVGSLDSNLIDKHNWAATTDYDASLFNADTTDWNNYIGIVETLQPGGPKYNNFGFMCFKNNRLYTSSGIASVERPATVQILNHDEWSFLQDDMTDVPGTESSRWKFVNTYALDIDPFDINHIYVACRTGLFEYQDGVLKNYFNKDNSIIVPATTSNRYCIVSGATYDPEGNLWFLQSDVQNNSIMKITKDGQWVTYPHEQLMNDGKSLDKMTDLFQDSRGLFWFVNDHWEKPSFYCYDSKTDSLIHAIAEFANQDGTTYINYNPHAIVEDLDGNIWIGTQNGPFMIESARIGSDIDYVTQVKVPRNDGTNYADYLLADVNITCIAVDGGNRKWFGTQGAGVYLISDDNMEQVQHFTTSNSPLLSDNVEAIIVNPLTGEVFFGTDQGLCSYMSDATDAAIEMVKDDVYAYPNPVVSGYDGMITVVGLSRNADVKILSASGQLVAQGRSNGGTFTWDGRDRQGRRVASGVYMVATATSDGKKGVVCKIAIIK